MLKNLTPGIRELLPSLLGGNISQGDEEFPGSETLRPLNAQSGTLSTYAIPADRPGSPEKWYGSESPQFPVRRDNDVEFYVDGEPTFEAMVEAIETATGPDHFIVLIGWAAHFDFQLSRNGSRTPSARRNAEQIFEERAKLGVRIRLLLWRNTNAFDGAPWSEVNSSGQYYCELTKRLADKWNAFGPDEVPRRSVTIIDKATRWLGSHHQKVLLVYGAEGLVGFVGGIDFNSDRVNREILHVVAGENPFGTVDPCGPLHDVHARVRGAAAEDLLSLVIDRWNYSEPSDLARVAGGTVDFYVDPGLNPAGAIPPASGREVEDLGFLLQRVRSAARSRPLPHYVVQLAQTVGNPRLVEEGVQNGVASAIVHAIRTARSFIYVEDQYFWSVQAGEAILDAAENVKHLTVLACSDQLAPKICEARRGLLRDLLRKNPDIWKRLRIYERFGVSHAYIHAKMSVFDDQLAIVGSANWNDRGFSHDSEVVALVSDPPWEALSGPRFGCWYSLELNAAKSLRLRLWAEHLGLPADLLADPIASEVYWRHPPASAGVRPYTVGGEPWHIAREVRECTYEQGGLRDAIYDPSGRVD
jgi:phosphatidylserine/phosphatidylglycerophosphate/cardiolipin synthase-like enzyme